MQHGRREDTPTNFQTGKTYKAGWNDMTTDSLEAVILVRKGAVIPTVPVAQSTKDIDWNPSSASNTRIILIFVS